VLPELASANRVKIHDSGEYALLPLEQRATGGLALVGGLATVGREEGGALYVSDRVQLPEGITTYTLSVKGDLVYVFGVENQSMVVFQMIIPR
jgi:hypothetical protein